MTRDVRPSLITWASEVGIWCGGLLCWLAPSTFGAPRGLKPTAHPWVEIVKTTAETPVPQSCHGLSHTGEPGGDVEAVVLAVLVDVGAGEDARVDGRRAE